MAFVDGRRDRDRDRRGAGGISYQWGEMAVMEAVERDYEFIDLAAEGGNQFLPKGVDYFGAVATQEEEAVINYIKFFGCRPCACYKGKGARGVYFFPYPNKEGEVSMNGDEREREGS